MKFNEVRLVIEKNPHEHAGIQIVLFVTCTWNKKNQEEFYQFYFYSF